MTDQQGKRQAERHCDETAFDVSELFSAPRMCPVAAQQGFDIAHTDRVTGKSWDLADSREQIRLWSQKLLIVSPPATKFSSVQHSRRGPTRRTPERPSHRVEQSVKVLGESLVGLAIGSRHLVEVA